MIGRPNSDIRTRDSDTWARLRRVLGWVVGAFVVLVGVPAAWLGLAHIAGVRLVSTGQDPLGLIVSLGGIMGAIFTIGGLVIALASILTALTVEDRVKTAFAAELPGLQRRADKQIEGYIALLQASQTDDWAEAETLTQEALAKYPDLPGAYSPLALRMARYIMESFGRQHNITNTSDYQKYLELLPVAGYSSITIADATDWLQRALDHSTTGAPRDCDSERAWPATAVAWQRTGTAAPERGALRAPRPG